MTSLSDRQAMARALQLADRGRYSTSPNPRVGCVVTRSGQLVAEGWHQRAGEGHAEVNALAQLDDATGCTAYVTLEPCSHFGRTPPCAQALINAGVTRVVIATGDPNPLVAGRGIAMLREANIDVECGLLEEEARALNRGFIRRIAGGRPWVTAKSAMSLDGRTAMANGQSQWITGPEARADVQRLRAQSCAIVSGVDTVIDDDAAFTVRPDSFRSPLADYQGGIWRQPLRVILDSQLRTPPGAKLFSGGGDVLIATVSDHGAKAAALQAAGAEIQRLPADDRGRVCLESLLQHLAERACNELMLEAGATLTGAFLQAGLIDDWFVYVAPCMLGSEARGLAALPLQNMADKQRIEIIDGRAIGGDWRWHCRPKVVDAEVEQN